MGELNKKTKEENFLKKSQEIIVGILKNSESQYGDLFHQFALEEMKVDLALDLVDIEKELKSTEDPFERILQSELSLLGTNYLELLYEDFKKTGQINLESFPFSLPPELFFIQYSTILDRTEQRKKTQEFWARSDSQNEYASWQKAGQEIISKLTEYWSSL